MKEEKKEEDEEKAGLPPWNSLYSHGLYTMLLSYVPCL